MNHYSTTWHHLRRSPFQSMAALVVTSISAFIILVYVIVSLGLSATVKYFETKPEITIFLKDGLDKTQVESLQREIASYPNIKEIKFISKDKALALYQQQNNHNPLLTEMVTASILPASFEVSVTDPKALQTIATNFQSRTTVVEEIVFEQNIVESLIAWSSIFRRVGLIVTASLLVISFAIILLVIGMKVTSHKDEVRVSRLLGASRFYIESPFILEGIFYGAVGSLISLLICFPTVIFFRARINLFFHPIVFISTDPVYFLFIAFGAVLGGILVGYLSSWLSVRRFIKF